MTPISDEQYTPAPSGAKPIEANPYGPNRKARRALLAADRRAKRRMARIDRKYGEQRWTRTT